MVFTSFGALARELEKRARKSTWPLQQRADLRTAREGRADCARARASGTGAHGAAHIVGAPKGGVGVWQVLEVDCRFSLLA